MSDDKLYSSTELTQALGCTRKALRVYQEHGLIAPVRAHGNQRYDGAAYQRLRLIVALRSADVSIDDIRRLLDLHDAQAMAAPAARQLAAELSSLVVLVTDRMQALGEIRQRLIVARETLMACSVCHEPAEACRDCAERGELDAATSVLMAGNGRGA